MTGHRTTLLERARALRARWRADRAAHVVGLEGGGELRYRVSAAYPHDPTAFTQGLAWAAGSLLESTGLFGRSSLRETDPGTGRVLRQIRLPADVFAEGVATLGERVVQLTWRSRRGLVYDRITLARIGEFSYAGEGWGLASDGARLVMSDGTSLLRFVDPDGFAPLGALEARDHGRAVAGLNDLQVVGHAVWANVWLREQLVRIALDSGEVTARLDLSLLCRLAENRGRGNVLNGVALEAPSGRLLVTGKRWPRIFALDLLP